MKTQFVTDTKGKKVAVLLSIKDYQQMLNDIDELECIKAYDKAKAKKQEFLPAADVFKAIEQKRKAA